MKVLLKEMISMPCQPTLTSAHLKPVLTVLAVLAGHGYPRKLVEVNGYDYRKCYRPSKFPA